MTPGMTLFRIAGLQTVWAVAEVPEAQAARLRARPEGQGDAAGGCVADVRRRAEGNPAGGQHLDANAQGTVRGRQPRRATDAGDAAAAGRRRAAERAPGGVVGSGDPHRQARGRHRAQRAGRVRAARRLARRRLRRRCRGRRRPERRRPGGRERTVPHRLRGALALRARQHERAGFSSGRIDAGQRRQRRSTTRKARSKARRPTRSRSRTARSRR